MNDTIVVQIVQGSSHLVRKLPEDPLWEGTLLPTVSFVQFVQVSSLGELHDDVQGLVLDKGGVVLDDEGVIQVTKQQCLRAWMWKRVIHPLPTKASFSLIDGQQATVGEYRNAEEGTPTSARPRFRRADLLLRRTICLATYRL